jgi:hypothetical protein
VGYSELLADVFRKTHYRRGRPIIITDGSDHAEAYLDRLAYQLKSGRLGMHGAVAVTAVTRGFAAISLREASTHWPDVIILRHPGANDEKLAALARGARRNTLKVVQAAAIGSTAGVTFAFGRSLIQTPSAPDLSLGPDPSGTPIPSTPSTPSTPASPASPASPSTFGDTASRPAMNSPVNTAAPNSTTGPVITSAKSGLGLATKVAAAGLVAVAVAVGATLVSVSAPLSPPLAAPAIETAPQPTTGTAPSQSGASPNKQPSIMPTECPTDPFWGTNGRQTPAEPGTTLNCIYSNENTSGYWTFSTITVFDGTTPPPWAEETKAGQEVWIDGTDAAWTLYKPPPDDISHLLISSANESLFILYHGSADEGIEHAKLLLHPR